MEIFGVSVRVSGFLLQTGDAFTAVETAPVLSRKDERELVLWLVDSWVW